MTSRTWTVSPWTADDIAHLKRICDNGGSYQTAATVLGRTRCAVAGKAQKLGLRFRGVEVRKCGTRKHWSEFETAVLRREAYCGARLKAILRFFPDRTVEGLRGKMIRLGLHLRAIRAQLEECA